MPKRSIACKVFERNKFLNALSSIFRLNEKHWTHAATIVYNMRDGKKLAMFTKHKPEKPKRKKKKARKSKKKKNVVG